MSDGDAERIVRLEEQVAHQAVAIEELSKQIADQWALIERLKREMKEMTDQFEAIEDQARAALPTQKPPHW